MGQDSQLDYVNHTGGSQGQEGGCEKPDGKYQFLSIMCRNGQDIQSVTQ